MVRRDEDPPLDLPMRGARSLLLVVLVACTPRQAATPDGAPTGNAGEPAFPRIASYRIETYLDPDAHAMLEKIPLAIVDAEVGALDADGLRSIRVANAKLELLAYLTSEEIARDANAEERPLADARFARIPATSWLLEPGSVTTTATSATTTSIRVSDPSVFSVTRPKSDFYGADEPTYLLIGDEHVKLVGKAGSDLIVERGFRSTATSHPAGTPIAGHVVFFAGTWMLDITGTGWRAQLADEAATLVTQGPWTGVFLDVCFEDIGFLNGGKLDLDRDRIADDPQVASQKWKAGFGDLVGALRDKLGPDVAIVANPGAQDCPHEALDGILLEGFPIGLPEDFLAFDNGLARYQRWSSRPGRRPLSIANAYSPKIGFGTIEPGQDEIARVDYAAMRFGLAIALMGDGYYAFDNGVFGHYVAWWYDEYDGGGRGIGWLGYPESAATRAGDAWIRRFTHGMAIANPSAAPVTVEVPPGYKRISGAQDRAHNNGATVSGSLKLPAHDGILLVR
jgi:hypothetical protein